MDFKKDFNFINKLESHFQKGNSGIVKAAKEWTIPNADNLKSFLANFEFQVEDTNVENFELPQVTEAKILAAMSGRFNPIDLASQFKTSTRTTILNVLSELCNIETFTDKSIWMLQNDARRIILESIPPSRIVAYSSHPHLPETDLFGIYLRKILFENADFDINEMDHQSLLDLSCVLEALEGTNFLRPNIMSVKALLETFSFTDNFTQLTQTFVGRENELAQLYDFLNRQRVNLWEGIYISGAGGTGKSTLIAKFSLDVLHNKTIPLIFLDFDRPGIDPEDSSWLNEEFARQLVRQYPAHSDDLKQYNNYNQLMQDNLRNSRESLLESTEYNKISSTIFSFISPILRTENISSILLVLDTMEEVVQQNSFQKLINWISTLAEALYIDIKVVFSGRTVPDNSEHLFMSMTIDAFDAATASAFLTKLGTTPDNIKQIVTSDKIPLRPLELKLIDKILKEQSITFSVLVQELFEGSAEIHSGAFFTGLIYRRILNRIKNPLVRKIAYPGLLLRYLTPELLLMLQPVIGIPRIDAAEAKKMTDDLAKYGWLCNIIDEKLWHRKDLRRTMIRMLQLQDPELAQSIHKAAISYFNQFDRPESKAESTYHSLMLITSKEEAMDIPLESLRASYDYLFQSIGDLPKPAAVILQFAEKGRVEYADIDLLPDAYFRKIYERTGRALVNRQQFQQAYNLYLRSLDTGIRLPANGIGIKDKWEQEMLFCLAEFEALRQLASYQLTQLHQDSIITLLNYLYPAILINPADVSPEKTARLLHFIPENRTQLIKDIAGPDSLTILVRLSYCLAVFESVYPTNGLSRTLFNRIYKVIKENTRRGQSERSLLILEYLSTGSIKKKYHPGISNLRIREDWFQTIKMFTNAAPLADATLALFDTLKRQPLSARAFLNQLDSSKELRESWNGTAVYLEDVKRYAVYDIVRGPNAIFRYPIKAALYQTLSDGFPLQALVDIFRNTILLNITDLNPDKLHGAISRNNDWLEPIIELIDRDWMLGPLLNKVCQEWKFTPKLQDVRDIFERWEKSMQNIFGTPL